jgi:hypothetical protein
MIIVLREGGSTLEYTVYLFASAGEDSAQPAATPTPAAPTPTPTPETPTVDTAVDVSGAALAFTLKWEGSADFDLAVTDPNGDILDLFITESDSGGVFGGDANGGCEVQFTNPAESVYWEADPPSGTYEIAVAYVLPCQDRGSHTFQIEITRFGEVIEVIEGELNEGGYMTFEWSAE